MERLSVHHLAEAPQLSEKAEAMGIADSKGLRPTHGWYSTGRYLRIGQAGAWLGIDHKNWSRYGISPFWVIFHNTEWGRSLLVREALKSWAPPRLFEQDGPRFDPLTVLSNVTREIVLEDLLSQLKQLYEALQSLLAPTIPTTFARMELPVRKPDRRLTSLDVQNRALRIKLCNDRPLDAYE